MATAAQIAPNRANAQKSTGPRTPEGKSHSSANSITHGLTGTHCLRTPAEAAALDAFTDRLLPELNPSTELQLELARRIVYTMFRLAQVPVLEANSHALSQAKTFLLEGKGFSNLALYEPHLSRSMHKDLDLLRKLQRESLQPAAKPRDAVQNPAPQPIDSPAPTPEIGFVYATAPADPASPLRPTPFDPETMAA